MNFFPAGEATNEDDSIKNQSVSHPADRTLFALGGFQVEVCEKQCKQSRNFAEQIAAPNAPFVNEFIKRSHTLAPWFTARVAQNQSTFHRR